MLASQSSWVILTQVNPSAVSRVDVLPYAKETPMKATTTWILLIDGAQAKVFEHSGPGTGLNAIPDLSFEEEPLMAREIMADKPGRSFASHGTGRSAMEYSSDPVQVREARFVKNVAEVLDRKLQESAFARLIVAAAPTALGDFRAAVSDRLKATIVDEMAKDLTNLPTPQLEKHFKDILAL
jgi:protein required for attachment to host cells